MSPELSSQPEHAEDQPLDAIVYDVHPALAPPLPQADYPYGRPAARPFEDRTPGVFRLPAIFRFDLDEAPAQYVVPKRFGLSAILGMTTALAILFGCMRWLDTQPVWYLFYGCQSIVICLVQMFHGKSPRKASAIAGAIMGPLFLLGTAWVSDWFGNKAAELLCLLVMMIPCGAGLGYLNGTCAAGIFLVMDKLEQYLGGSTADAAASTSSPAVPVS